MLLTQERVAIKQEFDTVVCQFGNVEVKLPYEAALQISAWIRLRAKEAKRFAGDNSRNWRVVGTLTDAEINR